ncbi:hybrid sensor histidine kinase/response regulator [Myxococcaceae bacterium GXIMD 01537]
MDSHVLRSLWPIFSAETREQVQSIGSKMLELEQAPSAREADLLPSLKRLVHSLKGSAASLGLTDIEQVVHAIEDGLARFKPDDLLPQAVVETTLRGLSAIEGALGRGDAGEAPTVEGLAALVDALRRAPSAQKTSGSGLASRFHRDGLKALEQLEGALQALCSPEVEDRAGRVRSAVEVAQALQAAAEGVGASEVVPLAREAASGFSRMEQAGDGAGLAASAIADALVALRMRLEPADATPAEVVPAPVAEDAFAPAESPKAELAEPAPAERGSAGSNADRMVRVSVKTLDSLSLQVEQLIAGRAQNLHRADTHREMLEQSHQVMVHLERAASQLKLGGVGSDNPALEPLRSGVELLRGLQKGLLELTKAARRDAEHLNLVAQIVRDDLRDVRMVPAAQVLDPLRRTVRELGGRLGKDVELVLAGGEVRLDRRILDALKDPLLHLVRNAIDHGLETPEVRRAAGKVARGRLEVRVEQRGTRVGLVVEDDGAGLDPARVRATAVRRGLLTAEAAGRLSEEESARLVFQPGFSTRDEVTATSGRGVGLDVVQATAVRLQGSVALAYRPGQGTRFTIDLPLTLAATLGLLVRCGTTVAAIPSDAVVRVVRLKPADVGTVAGRVLARVDGQQLAFLSLSEAIGMPRLPLLIESGKPQPVLLLSLGGDRAVFAIDSVVGQQEIVVRALGKHLQEVRHLAGAAVLDDGRVVPVLNASELLRAAAPTLRSSATETRRPRILVCDDSLTTRFAMKSLLEIAGYPVVTASDGEEAWGLLERTRCQLVVSDWQMPRLDGVGLARRIKSHPTLHRTPIILVTSLDSPEDRAAGLEAGADGYLVKREVERGKLLELVRQLMPASAD